MNYWLMKTEPDTFSIDDLKNSPKKTTSWDGVRNYQARNYMRDEMRKGDLVFIYHSNCKEIGIVGLASVAKTSYPDPTQFQKESQYYDPKSTEENPRWFLVDVKFEKKFSSTVSLQQIKEHPVLKEMFVAKRSRLSITPVSKKEYEIILKLL